MRKKLFFATAATFGIALQTTSPAATILFETSWTALVSAHAGNSLPVSRVVFTGDDQPSRETPMATLVDSDLFQTSNAADLQKTNSIPRITASGRYSLVPAEWNYSIVTRSVPWSDPSIKPGRNEVKVPRDREPNWGSSENYGAPGLPAIGGSVLPSIEVAVPDGGQTAALLALGLIGVGCLFRLGSSSPLRELTPPAANGGPAL